ncbi:hypothetical protein [Kingella kingae]|uniref:hypothetical protein n=1 Tax=Kingella kingae TaxID=504 RepID=UPI002556D108|nr:hypothetical protein [Kingella kingae]MDK4668159.1 hypothetical protein [Kingella kingae]
MVWRIWVIAILKCRLHERENRVQAAFGVQSAFLTNPVAQATEEFFGQTLNTRYFSLFCGRGLGIAVSRKFLSCIQKQPAKLRSIQNE